MTKNMKKEARVNLRLNGRVLDRLRSIMDVIGFNGEAECCRYLINRGIEATADRMKVIELYNQVREEMAPQELFPFLLKEVSNNPDTVAREMHEKTRKDYG